MKSTCLHFNISSTKLRKYLGENVLFSYYTLGNIEDESRILDARDEDIFLFEKIE